MNGFELHCLALLPQLLDFLHESDPLLPKLQRAQLLGCLFFQILLLQAVSRRFNRLRVLCVCKDIRVGDHVGLVLDQLVHLVHLHGLYQRGQANLPVLGKSVSRRLDHYLLLKRDISYTRLILALEVPSGYGAHIYRGVSMVIFKVLLLHDALSIFETQSAVLLLKLTLAVAP